MSNSNTGMSLDLGPERSDAEDCRKVLYKLAAEYSRKLLKNYRNLDSGEREAAHDLRVTTRRLQAILDLISCGKAKGKPRKVRSRLKRLRHAVGDERDLEITLLRARQFARRVASSSRRKLWRQIANDTRNELAQSKKHARRKLAQIHPQDLQRQIERTVQKHLESNDTKRFIEAEGRARDKLSACITTALASEDSSHYHAVRIKAKSLRYLLELLSQLHLQKENARTVELLKSVQDELGDWHDEAELNRRATALLSKTPDLQADEIATALLDSLRNQMRRANDHAREIVVSLASGLPGIGASRDSRQNERKRPRVGKS